MREEPTLPGLITSLAGSFFNSLRQNKLAAALAGVAFAIVTFFAATSQYDERPQYRASILPHIVRAESDFARILERAENEPAELRRLQYFLNAHYKAKEILKIIGDYRPMTAQGARAHAELIRYYSLVNEDMAIIRTEMSLKDDLDYLAEWKRYQSGLHHIREKWLAWVNGTS
jgi:hypothetical protein